MIKRYFKLFIFTIIYFIPIYFKLKNNNISRISIFNFLKWRNGYSYFRGKYLGSEVFVKVDTKLHLISNDQLAYNLCKKELSDSLVNILYSSLEGNIKFIVYEFVDGHELTKKNILQNPDYINDMFRIIHKISEIGIVHRDIKLDNFLLYDNKLKIIDFTFANSNIHHDFREVDTNIIYNCFLLEFLGGGFNPSPFVWDDFYSLSMILKKINEKDIFFRNKENINHHIIFLNNYIGKHEYKTRRITNSYYIHRRLKIKIKEFLGLKHMHRPLN